MGLTLLDYIIPPHSTAWRSFANSSITFNLFSLLVSVILLVTSNMAEDMVDTRYKPHEGIPHVIPLVMFIPSTILFIFLCFIILKKSPEGMRRYKYVIFFVSVSKNEFFSE